LMDAAMVFPLPMCMEMMRVAAMLVTSFSNK
jgi:hypothetical protein